MATIQKNMSWNARLAKKAKWYTRLKVQDIYRQVALDRERAENVIDEVMDQVRYDFVSEALNPAGDALWRVDHITEITVLTNYPTDMMGKADPLERLLQDHFGVRYCTSAMLIMGKLRFQEKRKHG